MHKPSILFISTSPNWPKTDGKRQRTWYILEALQKEFEIDYLFIGNSDEYTAIQQSGQVFQNLFFLEENAGSSLPFILLDRKQRQARKAYRTKANIFLASIKAARSYKFIFFRYIDSYFLFNFSANDFLVTDIDDVFVEKKMSQIKAEKRLSVKVKRLILFTIQYPSMRQAYQRMNLLFVSKHEDKTKRFLGSALILPNLPFSCCESGASDLLPNLKPTIGFVGKLSYKPNEDGLKWFLKHVWPSLLERIPEVHLLVAGAGKASSSLKELMNQAKGVEYLGFVEDVKSFWERVSVSIVPVFVGGGSNIKIAESLSYGRPVVCNHFSARGYLNAKKKGVLLIANSSQEWIKQFEYIYSSSEKLLSLSQESFNYAVDTYDLNEWKKSFSDQLTNALNNQFIISQQA